MKRQLKTLKGKRVVLTNNANEITRNEIGIIEKQDGTLEVKEHDANGNIENIAGGSSGGSSKYAPRYFSIDFNIADEGWKYLLSIKSTSNIINQDNVLFNIGATYKTIPNENSKIICSYAFSPDALNDVTQFSYIPLYMSDDIAYQFGIKGGFFTFEDIITNMVAVLKMLLGKDVTLSMNGITEITEDEFYTI